MKLIKSQWMIRALSLFLAGSLINGNAADRGDKDHSRPQRENQGGHGQGHPNQGGAGQGNSNRGPQGQGDPSPNLPNQSNRGLGNSGSGDRAQGNRGDGQVNRNPARPNPGSPTPGHPDPDKEKTRKPEPEIKKPAQPKVDDQGSGKQRDGKPDDGKGGAGKNGTPKVEDTERGKKKNLDGKPEDTKGSEGDRRGGRPPVTDPKPKPVTEPQKPEPDKPAIPLTRTATANGHVEKDPLNRVRVREEKGKDGTKTEIIGPTGRKESEKIVKPNGDVQKTEYGLNGKPKQTEVLKNDGKDGREVTTHHAGRSGGDTRIETVKYNSKDKQVSKVVEKNITVNKNVVKVSHHYDYGRYGYVYRPYYVEFPRVFTSWYDPYWYGPGYAVHVHPFHYNWSWADYGWYHRYHGLYWTTYDVYPTPAYWVTDWMVAGYLADRYEARVTAAQVREEAALARKEAAEALRLAQEAKNEAALVEAQAAVTKAEARARDAEERAKRAERQEALAGKPNSNVKPLDKQTKEEFREQIEKTIAEKKDFAEQEAKGAKPLLPDVTKALANPKHIYPVSKEADVVLAEKPSERVTLSEGDLLRLEPGQEADLKDANENTFLTMRVMTSKGEDGGAKAGQLVSVPVRDLQEFDSEFRAKLDLGLAQAETNQDLFKQGAL